MDSTHVYYGEDGDDDAGCSRMITGGREVSVERWGGYEIDRRRLRPDIDIYKGRVYISAEDVIDSVFRLPSHDCDGVYVIKDSIIALMNTVKKYEQNIDLGEYTLLPSITSNELLELSTNPYHRIWLVNIVEKISILCQSTDSISQLQNVRDKKEKVNQLHFNLPKNYVKTDNINDIRILEKDCIEYINALERYYLSVAKLFDIVSDNLNGRIKPR